jgi:hypothetical protein
VKPAVAIFPELSTAVHCTGVAPSPNIAPDAGTQLAASVPATTSVAVAVKLTFAPAALVASTVSAAGTVTAGAVVSATVTVKLPLVPFPDASVAVQLTVVAPNPNVPPDPGVHVTDTVFPSASTADAANLATPPAADVASKVALGGRLSVGPTVVETVTVNVADAAFPAASVDEQLTSVVPSANVDPETGVQTTGRTPSTTSSAETAKLTTASAALAAVTT